MSVRVETLCRVEAGTGGLSLDDEGNLFSGDFGAILGDQDTMGRQVLKIAPDGKVSQFASGLEGASGNCFGPDGALYQSNIRGDRISRIDSDAVVTDFVSNGIVGPVGLAFDSRGRLHVANCGNNTVARVEHGQAHILAEDQRFKCPNGLAFDDEDNLYMANFYDGQVFRINPAGQVKGLAEVPGGNNGHLTFLKDRLIVVARGAHQLYELSLDGQLTVLAGSGRCGGQDGPGENCEFAFPNAIAVASDGMVYINESAAPQADGLSLAPTRIRRVFI